MDQKIFRRLSSRLSTVVKGAAKVGAVVVIGVVAYKNSRGDHLQKVHASWTTGYEPNTIWDPNWDRRDPKASGDEEKAKNCTPTASRHILLIRHGQYFDDAIHDKERFLTNLGRAQADLTGHRLKQLDLPYVTLVSSTMTRALETAKLIHKHIPELTHITDDSLREGAPVPPEPPIGTWSPEPKQFFQDGARIESAYRKYFHRANASQKEDSYEIIVCHANVIRYFICRALQFPPEGWLRFSLAHSSISHVVIRPSGRITVRGVGDHGFMPPDQISFS